MSAIWSKADITVTGSTVRLREWAGGTERPMLALSGHRQNACDGRKPTLETEAGCCLARYHPQWQEALGLVTPRL